MSDPVPSADLAAFIEELRRRHAAGEFVDAPEIHLLPHLTIRPQRAIEVMLWEVDRYAAMDADGKRRYASQRAYLARQLRALRERLDGVPLSQSEIDEVRRKAPG